MSYIGYMNDRVKRLSIVDVKLVQCAAMFIALIVVKLIPQIMQASLWWFVVLAVLCGLRPTYVFFLKKSA